MKLLLYPNKRLPKFINIGLLIDCNLSQCDLMKKIKLIEKKSEELRKIKMNLEFVTLILLTSKGWF